MGLSRRTLTVDQYDLFSGVPGEVEKARLAAFRAALCRHWPCPSFAASDDGADPVYRDAKGTFLGRAGTSGAARSGRHVGDTGGITADHANIDRLIVLQEQSLTQELFESLTKSILQAIAAYHTTTAAPDGPSAQREQERSKRCLELFAQRPGCATQLGQ
jgi:hypothetical protein